MSEQHHTLFTHIPHPHRIKNPNDLHSEQMTLGQRIADMVATFVGSWGCVALHSLWFTLWFYFKIDINLLTLIVSLEAIFLCTFLMMSQNRQAEKDRIVAGETFKNTVKEEEETRGVIEHLYQQDAELLKQTRHIERLLSALSLSVEESGDTKPMIAVRAHARRRKEKETLTSQEKDEIVARTMKTIGEEIEAEIGTFHR